VSRPRRLTILVVSSDGSRPLRFNVPRWTTYAVLIAGAVGMSTFGTLLVDYARVRELAREPQALRRQVAQQRALIDSFRRRAGEIRLEVATWRDLHAKIWEPFGRDASPANRPKGIGGASEAARSERTGARPSALEEVDLLAETVTEEGQSLRALERLMARAGKALALMPSHWPVRGAINSEFGRRPSPWFDGTEFHGGLDIAADRGTAVRAPAPGTVVFAGPNAEFGLTVILEHSHDIRTLYGHLSKLEVRAAQKVERGQVIALTGNTGKSTGPHLHYEVRVKGQSVNPRTYLWD
jgi:murein DD-endopeptidase MepM/ murein hydrolase activator NlpD